MHALMMALHMLTNHDSEEGCGFAVAMVPRPQSLAAWPPGLPSWLMLVPQKIASLSVGSSCVTCIRMPLVPEPAS